MNIGRGRDIADAWFVSWRKLVMFTMPLAAFGYVEPLVLASIPGIVGYVPLRVLRSLDRRMVVR